LYKQAIANGWLKSGTELVGEEGEQLAALEYQDLSQREIFDAVERFYKRYYLRWRPIRRMLWTMLQDGDVMKRRLREGREFFQFLRLRSRKG
ncbi:MAG: hopanoid biosynthesis associated radical SAM protein HpnJ, partial [Chthoniobacterales bacterium]